MVRTIQMRIGKKFTKRAINLLISDGLQPQVVLLMRMDG
jgi:hypothetical protein